MGQGFPLRRRRTAQIAARDGGQGSAGEELRHSLRAVYDIKIAAVFHCPGSGGKELLGIAAVPSTGVDSGLAGWTCRKIRGIGNHTVKASRCDFRGKNPKICAYTVQTVFDPVVPCIFQRNPI